MNIFLTITVPIVAILNSVGRVNTNELESLFDYWKYSGGGSLNETYN